eukprot:scaffold26614_cov29-Phaeocystis_antarctica.AAC.1
MLALPRTRRTSAGAARARRGPFSTTPKAVRPKQLHHLMAPYGTILWHLKAVLPFYSRAVVTVFEQRTRFHTSDLKETGGPTRPARRGGWAPVPRHRGWRRPALTRQTNIGSASSMRRS